MKSKPKMVFIIIPAYKYPKTRAQLIHVSGKVLTLGKPVYYADIDARLVSQTISGAEQIAKKKNMTAVFAEPKV